MICSLCSFQPEMSHYPELLETAHHSHKGSTVNHPLRNLTFTDPTTQDETSFLGYSLQYITTNYMSSNRQSPNSQEVEEHVVISITRIVVIYDRVYSTHSDEWVVYYIMGNPQSQHCRWRWMSSIPCHSFRYGRAITHPKSLSPTCVPRARVFIQEWAPLPTQHQSSFNCRQHSVEHLTKSRLN